MSFVERHGLTDDDRSDAARTLLASVADSVDVVRLSFVDTHGILRGKTIAVGELEAALSRGWGFPSSMLLKDTSHTTVYNVFGADAAKVPDADFLGVGDLLMIPDATTFRVLPWAERTGWMLCDVVKKTGEVSPFCTRSLYRRVCGELGELGWDHTVGIEIEFQVFRIDDVGNPVVLNDGYQYLTEQRFDDLEAVLEPIRRGVSELDLPLRSIEVEFGPSQVELTLAHGDGERVADDVALLRSAIKQICRRIGYHATFMCRPQVDNVMSSGWHLHQSFRSRADGSNVLSADGGGRLSDIGLGFVAGILDHARGATALTNPTINSYRRFRPNSLAPDRIAWGVDSRAAMVRAILDDEPQSVRLENRVGDPAANPYLYLASQVISGVDGMRNKAVPAEPSTAAYEVDAPRLPAGLADALEHLEQDSLLRRGLGDAFVEYFVHIKRAELARFDLEVTAWEQREYFELF